MAYVLQRGIETLIQNGLVELLIFSLIFAMVYGILQSIKLFGDEDEAKKYNLIIAIAFVLLVIVPHFISPGSKYDIVPMVTRAVPQTMLFALAALGLMILLGMFGLQNYLQEDGKKHNWVVALVILGIIIYIFVGATGTVWGLPYWLTPDLIAALLAILVFALIISFVMSGESAPTEES